MSIDAFATALQLVKHYEGFRAKAYKDPVGIWTVGYGETGWNIGPDTQVTEAEASIRLSNRLLNIATRIGRLVDVGLAPNEMAALLSFIYNVGDGAFAKSTLRKKLNNGADPAEVAAEFLRWNKAGGRVLLGLKRRRAAESLVFLGGDVDKAIETAEAIP